MVKLFAAFSLIHYISARNDTASVEYADDEAQRHQDEEEEAHSEEALSEQFKHYDLNEDLQLDAAEIRSVFGNKIDPGVLFQFFLRVDTDESGTMSREEYLTSQKTKSLYS